MPFVVGVIIFILVFNAPGFLLSLAFPSEFVKDGSIIGASFICWIAIGAAYIIWIIIDKIQRNAADARERERKEAEAVAARKREAEAERLRQEALDREHALKNAAISERNAVKNSIDDIFG